MSSPHVRSARFFMLALCSLVGSGCIIGIFDDDDDDIGNTNFEAVRTFSETVAADARVRVRIIAVNGSVEVHGRLDATSVEISGDIDVDNVNGSVVATDLSEDATVDIVNGRVEVGVLELNGEMDLGSVNGNVELTLPTSSSAEISADLANGSIRVSGLTLTDQVVTPRSLRGILGGGCTGWISRP